MDTTSFNYSAGVEAHLLYFGIAIAAVLVFVAIYIAITPGQRHEMMKADELLANALALMLVRADNRRRRGQPLVIKMTGVVEPYYLANPGEAADRKSE